jgi:uncharacterized UPF0160 family protein
MGKMWINPDFKGVYEKKPSETKEKTDKKFTRKPLQKTDRFKLQDRKKIKINPSEAYINRKIKERHSVILTFIDNQTCQGIIEWVDQRYMKIRQKDDGKGFVIEKRAIKYMK